MSWMLPVTSLTPSPTILPSLSLQSGHVFFLVLPWTHRAHICPMIFAFALPVPEMVFVQMSRWLTFLPFLVLHLNVTKLSWFQHSFWVLLLSTSSCTLFFFKPNLKAYLLTVFWTPLLSEWKFQEYPNCMFFYYCVLQNYHILNTQ